MTPSKRIRLVAEILLAYWETRSALASAPIGAVVERLRRGPARTPPAGVDSLPEARRLGRAVARSMAVLPGDTRCLMQALVLTRLLARREIASKLVIGARTDPHFFAHAWVEHAGQPVLSPGDSTFGRLVEL